MSAKIRCLAVLRFFTDALFLKDWSRWVKHSKDVNALPLHVVKGGRISMVARTLSTRKVLDSELVGKMGKSER